MKILLPFDELISFFITKWQLTKIHVLQNLTERYVAFAYSELHHSIIALKIYSSAQAFFAEKQALEFYQGNGCIKLLAYDIENHGLLLQAITPSHSLKPLFPDQDNLAIQYASDVIKKMHLGKELSSSGNYPVISEWLSLLDYFEDAQIPANLINKAKILKDKLLNSQKDLYLLHGDLHHENILLDACHVPIAIDPKGVVGELAYEIGAFVRNPFVELVEQKNIEKIISYRIKKFSQLLELDPQRLRNWSFVQAVLAACWAIEDEFPIWENFLLCAEVIAEKV